MTAHRGKFPYCGTLGSRLYQIAASDSKCEQKVLETIEEALEFMGKCEKVYCPLKDFGIMNEKNRELLKKAKETGKLNQIR